MQNPGKLKDGISLMKNLGLTSDSDDSDENDPFEVKVRPKNVGVTSSFSSKPQKSVNYLIPSGAWMSGHSFNSVDFDPRTIGDEENGFAIVPICKSFQQSLVKFHHRAQRAESHKLNLDQDIENTKERIRILKSQINHSTESENNKKNILSLIQTMNEKNFNFDNAIRVCLIIASDPSVVEDSKMKNKLYTKKAQKKREIDPKHLAFSVVATYLKPFLQNIDPSDLHLLNWSQAKDWINSVGKIIDNTLLWDKFLKHKIYPIFHDIICKKENGSLNVTELIKGLYNTAIMSQHSVLQFFYFTARPFLVRNLERACQSRDILYWIDLAQTVNVPDQFANIVLEYANRILSKWNPDDRNNDKIVSNMLKQWPQVLGNSLDFFYGTIAPKLKESLRFGHIDVINMWISYFPIDLTASLVSDYFLEYVRETIRKVENPRIAAQTYLSIKQKIPNLVSKHPKIIQKLITILDELKLKNKTISTIRASSIAKSATPADVLQLYAAKYGKPFHSIEPIECCQTFQIGDIIVAIKKGALHILENDHLIPIFVSDLQKLLQ